MCLCDGLCDDPAWALFSLLPRSLADNDIGADGARALGEGLKVNTTLTSLECAKWWLLLLTLFTGLVVVFVRRCAPAFPLCCRARRAV